MYLKVKSMESNFSKTIERLLHEILCEALKYNLKYEDFIGIIISAYGYRPKKAVYMKLTSKIETLLGVLHEYSTKYFQFEFYSVDILRNLISGRKAIDKAYLIDNLGLPEIYALAKNFGYSNISLKIMINRVGNTQTFKNIFGVNYMSELSRILGAQLITEQDRLIHEIFGQWFEYYELLKAMGKLLKEGLLEIIKSTPAIIIADHGYDIEHINGYYKLCHGLNCQRAVLSMICPFIFISH